VRDALRALEAEFGKDVIDQTKRRFRDADQDVYAATMKEHEDRVSDLFGDPSSRRELAAG
jgi:hypothetical protein